MRKLLALAAQTCVCAAAMAGNVLCLRPLDDLSDRKADAFGTRNYAFADKISSSVSIAVWVKDVRAAGEKFVAGVNGRWNLAILHDANAASDGKLAFRTASGNAMAGGYVLDDGNWHFVVGTFNRDAVNPAKSFQRLYVDGALAAELTDGIVALSAPDKMFTLGGAASDMDDLDAIFSREGLYGRFAELSVWNCALSAAEVSGLYTRTTRLAGNENGLVAYWPLTGEPGMAADGYSFPNAAATSGVPNLESHWTAHNGTGGVAIVPDDGFAKPYVRLVASPEWCAANAYVQPADATGRSWKDPLTNLVAVAAAAKPHERILCSPGTHKIETSISPLVSYFRLGSCDPATGKPCPETAIVDAQRLCRHFTSSDRFPDHKSEFAVENLTFVNGRESCGGSMYFKWRTGTIDNCTFRDNAATGCGGAYYAHAAKGTVVSNCRFYGNSAVLSGGAVALVQAFESLADYQRFADCVFSNNMVAANGFGGAVYVNRKIELENCLFSDNSGGCGSHACVGANSILRGCVFAGTRRARHGTPLWIEQEPVTIVNCEMAAANVGTKAEEADSLERGFADPPKANRPQVWWWFDAIAPYAAITRDLEGLKRVGISGFHVYGGSATGKGWLPRVKWALHEANRLGLDGVVCIGSAGCEHPQTDLDHVQKALVFTEAHMESRNGQDAGCAGVVLPKKGVGETPKNGDGSPMRYWDVAVLAVPDTTNDVPVAEVRDVSRFLNRETGVFAWPGAPEGRWRIVRVGYVPKVDGWTGCYIDHMSRAAFDAHWAHVMTPLLDALAPDERAALKGVMCDSWEAGKVSWTDTFAEEFRRRRGYDILPWLPAKAGVRLGDAVTRSRFLRDFDETVSELIAENHYAYQKEVANRHGLVSIAEAAGPHQHQGDVRRMQGRCDVAMGEFWMPSGHRPLPPQRFMVRDAANAAHVYGMGEVLAEAFTTINTYWIESPATMKPCADRAFCDGLTRVCYHGMKLSPSLADKPGFIRLVGTQYNPQTTWFDQSGAFNLYLSRCSWMLSQGRFVADCLLYAGDAIDLFAGLKTPSDGLGEGFDYDFCPTELLMQAHVEDGQVVLPSGMRYKVLMLSDRNPKTSGNMYPGSLKKVPEYPPVAHDVSEAAMLKLRELVEAGATLVGVRPSGPTGMNESSARYNAAADALWGSATRQVGKGWVFHDRATARERLTPDVAFVGAPLDWIHRTLPDGTDVYFVSNQKGEAVRTTAAFRQPGGKSVELWDAVTGTRTSAGTGPCVSLDLPPYGSMFVVFLPCASASANIRMGDSPVQASLGAWTVAFDPSWGGPEEPVSFPSLVDWTTRPEPGIRHYSGTATYRTTFDAPSDWRRGESVRIDLGTVHEVADVLVNGELVGTVWTAPFAVTTPNVKGRGNVLEVRVTNLWPNRLIYDAGLPVSERLTRTNINPYKPSDPLLPSGLLGPVRIFSLR